MIQRVRPALIAALVLIMARLVISPTTESTAQPAIGQEAISRGLRVVLGSDPKTGQRYIQLVGQIAPTYPTIDVTCDGTRWTVALTRSEQGSVYKPSRSLSEAMLGAIDCRMLLPDQEVVLSRAQLWAAWANPGRGSGPPNLLVGQVVEVIDGNTFRVNLGDRAEIVRYIGINVKETTRPTRGSAPSGEAADSNRQLVARQQVRLELDTQERDREGRLLAYVYVADRMVNAELVRRGSAEIMTIPPNVRHRDLFVTLEQEARDDKRGLWADPSEPPPTPVPRAEQRRSGERPGVPPESAWTCPVAQPIKGSRSTYSRGQCIYHVPDSENYSVTTPERCYATIDEARRDDCLAARR